MKIDVPCIGCKDRTAEPNCHSLCERYIAYDTMRKALIEDRRKERELDNIQYDLAIRRRKMGGRKLR